MGMEKLSQILLPTTEIGESVIIANTIRADTPSNLKPTIQPTTVHFKKSTGAVYSDWGNLLILSLNNDIYVPIYGQNIDKQTGINHRDPL